MGQHLINIINLNYNQIKSNNKTLKVNLYTRNVKKPQNMYFKQKIRTLHA